MRRSARFVAEATLELQPDVRWLLTFLVAHYSSLDRSGNSISATVSPAAVRSFRFRRVPRLCYCGVCFFWSQGAWLWIGESLLWVGRPDPAWFLWRTGVERDYARAKEPGAPNWDSAVGLGNE